MHDGDLEVIVRQIRSETSEVRSFVLELASGEPLPQFKAGAHVDVFPIPGLSRQYSLVNDAADCSQYVLGVKREPNSRGGRRTTSPCAKTKAGTSFWQAASA